MHVLITNVYSYQNKGDAAIVIALLQEVRRAFPQATIHIQTTDIQHDKRKYGAPVSPTLLWTLLSAVRGRPFHMRLWRLVSGWLRLQLYLTCMRLMRRAPRWLLPATLQSFVDDIQAADLVIACGGGYLRTASKSLTDVLLLKITCLNFLAAKRLGKPVYLYSQSIGPVHGRWQRAILRRTLNQVDIIEPREDVSQAYLAALDVQNMVTPTADPVFLLGGQGSFPFELVQPHPRRLHVGITVRRWFQTASELNAYIHAVAQTIDHLIKRHDAEVWYVPQVIAGSFGDDDRLIARQVRQAVTRKDRFTVIEADLHPFQMIGLCGHMDAFIGTRMHSNIFALINEVPVVAIEYEHKTKGIMRGLGLEQLTIPIHEVTAASLIEHVELLLARRTYFQRLIHKHLPAQISQSRKAIEVIKTAYETLA
ncbi:MAG TPA: polysaccharide pyruvyl transferase family protein [Candidatus Saccharimonadales bacterium]|nr:polysaccharide pyruvyl transferase family protein [Candidatus Saccharimonadales bacterium]